MEIEIPKNTLLSCVNLNFSLEKYLVGAKLKSHNVSRMIALINCLWHSDLMGGGGIMAINHVNKEVIDKIQ